MSHGSSRGHVSQENRESQAVFLIRNVVAQLEEIIDLWGGKHPSVRTYKTDTCGLAAGQRGPMIRKPHVLASR